MSSAHLGVFPTTFPSRDRIDWLPVDKLSRILFEILLFSCNASGLAEASQVYHVVNPHTTSWSTTFAKSILASYPQDTPMRSVTFEEWVRILSDRADEMEKNDAVDVDRNPAIRLVDFYVDAAQSKKGARAFVSDKAVRASSTLRKISAVNRVWIDNWMMQWGIGV